MALEGIQFTHEGKPIFFVGKKWNCFNFALYNPPEIQIIKIRKKKGKDLLEHGELKTNNLKNMKSKFYSSGQKKYKETKERLPTYYIREKEAQA